MYSDVCVCDGMPSTVCSNTVSSACYVCVLLVFKEMSERCCLACLLLSAFDQGFTWTWYFTPVLLEQLA
jgi:hypothetical protein